MSEPRIQLMSSKCGRRFAGFLKALNSGDPDVIYDFVKDYTTDEALEQQSVNEWAKQLMAIHRATGMMRVVQVAAAEEYRVIALLEAQSNGAVYLTEMSVSEDYPHKVAEFKHQPA